MPLIFGTSNPTASSALIRAVARGELRKLAPKIYADDLKDPPEKILRSHRFEIIAHFYPTAVISFRTALANGEISPGGQLHITVPGSSITIRRLPNLEIRIWPGPGPQPEDHVITTTAGPVCMANRSRALLENLFPGRARGEAGEAKTLSRAELETWLEREVRLHGIAELDRLLEGAKAIASRFHWEAQFARLGELAADIKGTGDAARLRAPVAIARAKGEPYDPDRIVLFTAVQARLAGETFRDLPATPAAERNNRAFWESYFSNYIEGTKFTVEEAQSILLASDPRHILKQRPKDAHDILETFRLITDDRICREVPAGAHGFLDLLKRRHARMMASRPEVEPGVFKRLANRVGAKTFVAPELVEGTLRLLWPMVLGLKDPVARALMVHFALAEIHPFSDGNGRISRLAMNAELDATGRMRLLIPTAFRSDYLTVLDALTRGGNAAPYVAFGHKLLSLNQAIPFETIEQTNEYFRRIGALDEDSALGLNLAALSLK